MREVHETYKDLLISIQIKINQLNEESNQLRLLYEQVKQLHI